MQMVYNSDTFVVVAFDVPASPAGAGEAPARGGYEIVDKFARKEIFIEGAVAEQFQQAVQALAERDSSPEAMDEFIGRYTALAQQPLVYH